MRNAALLLAAILLVSGCDPEVPTVSSTQSLPVSSFPTRLDPRCGGRADRIYDDCVSQMQIFRNALELARRTGKTVIVSYGAEWCIWCHVFDAHLRGETGQFNYPETPSWFSVERSRHDVLRDARALNQFASQNLIIAHIEGDRSPDGRAVLEATGASAHFTTGYPFVFSVTPAGRYAAKLNFQDANVKLDNTGLYQGYNRAGLLTELRRLRDAARRAPT